MTMEIIKGASKDFNVSLVRESNGKPYDLTGVLDLGVALKSVKEYLVVKESVSGITRVNDLYGEFKVSLTKEQTLLLDNSQSRLDLIVFIDLAGGKRDVAKLKGSYTVEENPIDF